MAIATEIITGCSGVGAQQAAPATGFKVHNTSQQNVNSTFSWD